MSVLLLNTDCISEVRVTEGISKDLTLVLSASGVCSKSVVGHCGGAGGHKWVQRRPVGPVVCRSNVTFTSEAKEELHFV